MKPNTRIQIDYSKTYTANNFITTVRAFNEYLLNPKDLEPLTQYKRRSPFEEYSQDDGHDLITVYLRSDVEKVAMSVWGSMETLNKEKEKRKAEYDRIKKDVFNLKKTLRDYQNRTERLENPYLENRYTNSTIYNSPSGRVVLFAIAVNTSNFLAKLIGWWFTGSASLFSEAVHSFADTINQILIAYGLQTSLKQPDSEHPYGYSNMTYITSLISGVGIFFLGTGVSLYHGLSCLYEPYHMESLLVGMGILFGSAISEGSTLYVAVDNIKKNSKQMGIGFWEYVVQSHRPSVNVVLLEDIAAVCGVFIAGTCMTISHYTANPLADCIGSLLIGGLMGSVASFIIYTNAVALVGKSIPKSRIEKIRNDLESDIMIRSIHDVKATDMGGQQTLFKGEVDIDGREITRSYLERIDIEKLFEEMDKVSNVQECEQFMLKHGQNVVDRVGAEIDRIEKTLRKKYPDMQHVDLEVL
jgi:solute carrier family 30 (zinc transporter), member 9